MARADLEQFKKHVEPQLSNLYRAAYRVCGNRYDAEDLVQETCLRAWQSFPAEKGAWHVDRWLLSVLYHLFIDRTRRDRRSPFEDASGSDGQAPEWPSPDPGPAALAERDDTGRVMDAAWNQLESTQKVLLTLRAEGYGLVEIEEITGIGRTVLRARLHRARRSFARYLQGAERSMETPDRIRSTQ